MGKTVVTDAVAKRVAEQLVLIKARFDVSGMMEAGVLLLKEIFNDDEAQFRSKAFNKGASLAKLGAMASVVDAGWSRDKLDLAIELHLLSAAQGGFAAWPHLQVSHLATVVGLPAEKQRSLLTQAEKEAWTVARLREAAIPHRTSSAPAEAGSGTSGAREKVAFLRELRDDLKAVTRWSNVLDGLGTRALKLGFTTDETTELSMCLGQLFAILNSWVTKLDPDSQPIPEGIQISPDLLQLLQQNSGKKRSARPAVKRAQRATVRKKTATSPRAKR